MAELEHFILQRLERERENSNTLFYSERKRERERRGEEGGRSHLKRLSEAEGAEEEYLHSIVRNRISFPIRVKVPPFVSPSERVAAATLSVSTLIFDDGINACCCKHKGLALASWAMLSLVSGENKSL